MGRSVTYQRGHKQVTVTKHSLTWWLLVGWWVRMFTWPVLAVQRALGNR